MDSFIPDVEAFIEELRSNHLHLHLPSPSSRLSVVFAPSHLTSNDAGRISNAFDPQPSFDEKKKGDTSHGPQGNI
ncbi:hypothetical protein RHMOL_Rhmol04G0314100 [Rhododendron molle]|uniref:Uncharacterized protein n=1 Tax=Rhododendron molle TaxID=49168 RepID=A0ACC0P810_RHOML|nr:hypothetical protein RHMOL_Rhmol04G0314100 [Rhododendron molle]